MNQDKLQYLPVKVSVLITTIVGASTIVVAPFVTDATKALGTLGILILSFLLVGTATVINYQGLKFVKDTTQNNPQAVFVPLLVYIVCISFQFAGIVCMLRLVAWALAHFYNIDVAYLAQPN